MKDANAKGDLNINEAALALLMGRECGGVGEGGLYWGGHRKKKKEVPGDVDGKKKGEKGRG